MGEPQAAPSAYPSVGNPPHYYPPTAPLGQGVTTTGPQVVHAQPQPYGAPVAQPQIILVNGCPLCKNGVLEDDFTCLGITLAICCFPVGLVCCWLTRERRCTNCRKAL